DWYSRHARRILQERAAKNTLGPDVPGALAFSARVLDDERNRLRFVWAAHATGGLTEHDILTCLTDKEPYVRGWAIQLGLENSQASEKLLKKLVELAKSDRSPVVRLYLASACQRLPLEQRWQILEELIQHREDSKDNNGYPDHNLPLMYWYAIEPLGGAEPE